MTLLKALDIIRLALLLFVFVCWTLMFYEAWVLRDIDRRCKYAPWLFEKSGDEVE